jgi:organic radical activating enzyme
MMKRFKKGIKVGINLSWWCNLQCSYCPTKKQYTQNSGDMESIEYWKDWISTFPIKIREVALSGGEPTLVPYFDELANWLLKEGYYVLILTNLTTHIPLMKIQPSRRLRIVATFHECYSKIKFLKNYEIVSKVHRVDVIEIEKEELSFSKKKALSNEERAKRIEYLRSAPNGATYRNCFELYGVELFHRGG